jgi:hypothetical protein
MAKENPRSGTLEVILGMSHLEELGCFQLQVFH